MLLTFFSAIAKKDFQLVVLVSLFHFHVDFLQIPAQVRTRWSLALLPPMCHTVFYPAWYRYYPGFISLNEFFTLQAPSILLKLNIVLQANLDIESRLAPPLGADLPSHKLSGAPAPAVAKQAGRCIPQLRGKRRDQCQQEPPAWWPGHLLPSQSPRPEELRAGLRG